MGIWGENRLPQVWRPPGVALGQGFFGVLQASRWFRPGRTSFLGSASGFAMVSASQDLLLGECFRLPNGFAQAGPPFWGVLQASQWFRPGGTPFWGCASGFAMVSPSQDLFLGSASGLAIVSASQDLLLGECFRLCDGFAQPGPPFRGVLQASQWFRPARTNF